jgi:hypothetical protein
LTVIASEANQSPSAGLGIASSLSLLAMTGFTAPQILRASTIAKPCVDTGKKLCYNLTGLSLFETIHCSETTKDKTIKPLEPVQFRTIQTQGGKA